MRFSSMGYEALLQKDALDSDHEQNMLEDQHSSGKQSKRLLLPLLLASLFTNLVFVVLWSTSANTCDLSGSPQSLYSPAQDAIEYEVVKFRGGLFNDKHELETPDIYSSPPSEEVDAAWEDLYNEFGISAISSDAAALLPNKTTLVPGLQSQYAVSLDVFHQLHCLNRLRKSLHPEYYPPDGDAPGRALHLTHCINSIRQSLQCSSDISTVVFKKGLKAEFEIVHSCRNFSKIREWAIEHRAGSLLQNAGHDNHH